MLAAEEGGLHTCLLALTSAVTLAVGWQCDRALQEVVCRLSIFASLLTVL